MFEEQDQWSRRFYFRGGHVWGTDGQRALSMMLEMLWHVLMGEPPVMEGRPASEYFAE